MLPDGKVLATGGDTTSDGRDLTKAALAAELWDPDTETWTTMAAQQTGALYHSTALLLPDARVLVAGGGRAPGGDATNELNARDLLTAVPLQGRAADDHERAGDLRLERQLHGRHARRGADRHGLADQARRHDARDQHEPALHPLNFTAGSGP